MSSIVRSDAAPFGALDRFLRSRLLQQLDALRGGEIVMEAALRGLGAIDNDILIPEERRPIPDPRSLRSAFNHRISGCWFLARSGCRPSPVRICPSS